MHDFGGLRPSRSASSGSLLRVHGFWTPSWLRHRFRNLFFYQHHHLCRHPCATFAHRHSCSCQRRTPTGGPCRHQHRPGSNTSVGARVRSPVKYTRWLTSLVPTEQTWILTLPSRLKRLIIKLQVTRQQVVVVLLRSHSRDRHAKPRWRPPPPWLSVVRRRAALSPQCRSSWT